jgi:hypothetical protein
MHGWLSLLPVVAALSEMGKETRNWELLKKKKDN